MTANKRTFEVDKFLTRQLLLRFPDNTAPSANQAILTDGIGGVYFSRLASTISSNTAFNRVNLSDSTESIVADLSYNILTFKEGPGVRIRKTGQYGLIFESALLVPSTFTSVLTPSGSTVIATSPSTVLEIATNYGVSATVSSNKLLLGGIPAFSQISPPAPQAPVVASATQSTLKISTGFGIYVSTINANTIQIGTNLSTYALNEVDVPNNSTFIFSSTFNKLAYVPGGNLQIVKTSPSSILFQTNSYSRISTPAGILYASSSSELLNISSGYGIRYSINSTALQIATSLPSSFSYISTARGTISTPYSTNTLTLNQGYGIDYQVSDQSLTIKLASTFASAIDTGTCSTVATADSKFKIRNTADGSILFSTATTGELYFQATDFNRINILDSTNHVLQSIFSYNTADPNPVINKVFQFKGSPGTSITAVDNTITIESFSSVQVTGPAYAFAIINTISSCQTKGQSYFDIIGNSSKQILANPVASAVLNMVPVSPLYNLVSTYTNVLTGVSTTLLYTGLDTSSLLYTTSYDISTIKSTLIYIENHAVSDYLSINTLSTANLNTQAINASSYSVLGSVVLSSSPTSPSFLSVYNISTAAGSAQSWRISTINDVPPSTPLAVLNYSTNSIGINIGSNQPQANLEVNGLVLAQIYATYSDSSLKNFKAPLKITEEDLKVMQPWNFLWKQDGAPDIGFAAEDVEKIVPTAVRRAANGLRVVDYGKLSAVAIAALRDTNQRLTAVESTLEGIRS